MKLRLSYKNYFSALTPKQFDSATTRFSGWLATHGHADLANVVEEASDPKDLKGTYGEMGSVLADKLVRKMVVPPADAWLGTTPKDLSFAPFQVFSEHLATFRGRKIVYLKKLGAAIEAKLGRPITLPEVEEGSVGPHLFEYGGMLAGVSGGSLDLGIPLDSQNKAERKADVDLHAALLFLRVARAGLLTGRGKLVKNLEPFEAFKVGAVAVWPDHPHFINPLARMWRLACLYGLVGDPSEDLSRGMGAAVAHWMRPQLAFALAGGLHDLYLERTMHRMSICELIYGRGWLNGTMELHEGDERFALTPGGRTRIIHNAQSMCDASLIATGVEDFQANVGEIEEFLNKFDERGEVRLASAIRANRKSMLATAIRYAWPQGVLRGMLKQAPYICAAVDVTPIILGSRSFGNMRRGLDRRVEELRTIGDNSIADIVEWMSRLFGGQMTRSAATAAERLGKREALFRDRGKDVLAEMMGIAETLLVRSLAYAEERGGVSDGELAQFVARMTKALDDTILAKTLSMNEGLAHLAETLETIPTLRESIVDETRRLKASGDKFHSGILEAVAPAIVIRAIYKSRGENYLKRIFARLPQLAEEAQAAGATSVAGVAKLVRRAIDKDMSVSVFQKYLMEKET